MTPLAETFIQLISLGLKNVFGPEGKARRKARRERRKARKAARKEQK